MGVPLSVSARHELLVELFRNQPALAAELAQRLGVLELSEGFTAQTLAADGSLPAPTEYRAVALDAVERRIRRPLEARGLCRSA